MAFKIATLEPMKSTTALVTIISRGPYPHCATGYELIELRANATHAEVNEAVERAEGILIAFSDAAIAVTPDQLAQAAIYFDKFMDLGGLAAQRVLATGQPAPSGYSIVDDRRRRYPIAQSPVIPAPGETRLVEIIALAGSVVRKAAFLCAGGLDDGYGHLAETEMFIKLVCLGWKLTIDPTCRVLYVPENQTPVDRTEQIAGWQAIHRRYTGRLVPLTQIEPDGTTRTHPWRLNPMQALTEGYARPKAVFDVTHDVTPSMSPVSVVVVAYNSGATIEACVNSVVATLGIEDELILVDNASPDGSGSKLAELAALDPRIKFIQAERNLGFSEGCNVGIRASKGEFITLLNPDTQVFEGWIGRTLEHFADENVAAVGPISNYVAGLQKLENHNPMGQTGTLNCVEFDQIISKHNNRRGIDVKLLIGFCMTLRKSALDQAGLLDEKCFLGADDLDISWRLRLAGFTLRIATDVFVLHEGHVSFKSEPEPVVSKLTQDSVDHLASKLVAHYGKGNVPSQEELWGTTWLKPTVSPWA